MYTQLTEKDFQPLVVTQDASIVLNQLHLDEQGTYRCSLQDENGAVYYRASFLLTGEVRFYYMADSRCNAGYLQKVYYAVTL